MEYVRVTSGRFIRRLNRFVAEVEREGRTELTHVKNTGRLKELLVPGAEVSLELADNPERTYPHSLIAVRKDGRWVNVDSQAPNRLAHEAILLGRIRGLESVRLLKREAAWGKSRFDLYFETDGNIGAAERGFIEVKGVTLESGGVAMFPDAPTARGTKHLLELAEAVRHGYAGIVLFVIQMKGCSAFCPHRDMDAPFAEALKQAAERGVRVLAYDSLVTDRRLEIDEQITVVL